MENKRRDFLKTACAPVVFSMFGVSIIDLNDSSFSAISEIGGWMNYSAEDMLLLRISDSEIRAYSNKCPHQGANNQWSYNNSMFNCGNHNRSFSDDCSSTSMTCYSTTIDGNTLVVTR